MRKHNTPKYVKPKELGFFEELHRGYTENKDAFDRIAIISLCYALLTMTCLYVGK